MLAGDFTTFASPACNAGRQITLRAPFVNNRIDPALYSKAALNIAAKLPQAQDECGKVTYGLVQKTERDAGRRQSRLSVERQSFHLRAIHGDDL